MLMQQLREVKSSVHSHTAEGALGISPGPRASTPHFPMSLSLCFGWQWAKAGLGTWAPGVTVAVSLVSLAQEASSIP